MEDVEEIIEKLDVTKIAASVSGDGDSQGSGDSGSKRSSLSSNNGANPDENEENNESQPANNAGAEDSKRKKSSFKFLKRLSSKDSNKDVVEKGKVRRTSQIPMDLKVDCLPQMFLTKYLGADVCTGLWGIQHTHGPVSKMVEKVHNLKKGQDLPLTQLNVSEKGINITMHKENKGRELEEGLIPVEFISYGVQDVKYTRVFSFIVVKEMSWRAKKMECHAYVCDSTATCRRLSLSVALAFKEYAATLGGQPYKFHVDLRPSMEIQKELKISATNEEEEADA